MRVFARQASHHTDPVYGNWDSCDPRMTSDANKLLTGLVHEQVSLELRPVDLCFVAALYLQADRTSAPSFDSETLVDVYEQVCDIADPGAENPRKRATNAIERLRKQRLLVRIDGSGVVSAGEFSLSKLGIAIVDFFLAEDMLTRESLTVLTRSLIVQLVQVRTDARKANTDDDWRTRVATPLRVAVSELIGGIERRQRGMDAQQAEIRQSISQQLEQDWFLAVDRCENLLEQTASTLRELNEILLRDTQEFHAVLQDLQQLATVAGAMDTVDAIQRVGDQIDRIVAWGSTRHKAWTDYYQYVARYVRDVIRLDPDRALSQRLRDYLAKWPDAPYGLLVLGEPSHLGVREVDPRFEKPPVFQPLVERDVEPDEVAAHDELDALRMRVEAAIGAGESRLSSLTCGLLIDVEPARKYLTMGRIAQLAAPFADGAEPERPWVVVSDLVEIEEWHLTSKRSG